MSDELRQEWPKAQSLSPQLAGLPKRSCTVRRFHPGEGISVSEYFEDSEDGFSLQIVITYLHTCISTNQHTYKNTYTHTNICACKRTCIHTYFCACLLACLRTYRPVCFHAFIFHTHTYAHACEHAHGYVSFLYADTITPTDR